MFRTDNRENSHKWIRNRNWWKNLPLFSTNYISNTNSITEIQPIFSENIFTKMSPGSNHHSLHNKNVPLHIVISCQFDCWLQSIKYCWRSRLHLIVENKIYQFIDHKNQTFYFRIKIFYCKIGFSQKYLLA